jgi:mono/diheme cytochrome c family protein
MVPHAASDAQNPLRAHPDSADAIAGREVYQQKCQICHGYDGSGKTEIAAGVQRLTDGELLFHITNGKPVHRLSHAADRADDRRCECPRSHLQVHHPGANRNARHPQPVRRMSQGQAHRLEYRDTQDMARALTMAHGGVRTTLR